MDSKNIALSEYRAETAYERLEAARLLLESGFYNDSINRSYYAIFSGARSLLALYEMDSRKHSGVISFFNRYFVKSGLLPKRLSRIIAEAREGREASDYQDYAEYTREEAEKQLERAKDFLQIVRDLTVRIIENPSAYTIPEA